MTIIVVLIVIVVLLSISTVIVTVAILEVLFLAIVRDILKVVVVVVFGMPGVLVSPLVVVLLRGSTWLGIVLWLLLRLRRSRVGRIEGHGGGCCCCPGWSLLVVERSADEEPAEVT